MRATAARNDSIRLRFSRIMVSVLVVMIGAAPHDVAAEPALPPGLRGVASFARNLTLEQMYPPVVEAILPDVVKEPGEVSPERDHGDAILVQRRGPSSSSAAFLRNTSAELEMAEYTGTGTAEEVFLPPPKALSSTNEDLMRVTRCLSNCYSAKLVMQSDGNLVLYRTESYPPGSSATSYYPVWASNTWNMGTGPYRATMQGDGNFVVYDSVNRPLWSSRTFGSHQLHLYYSGWRANSLWLEIMRYPAPLFSSGLVLTLY